jgi:hypothetical protein
MFLNVSTSTTMYFDAPERVHLDCGTAWRPMFSKDSNGDLAGAKAAYPRLWIAGSLTAVGMGIAFWGASRGRLLSVVGYALLAAGLVGLFSWILTSSNTGTALRITAKRWLVETRRQCEGGDRPKLAYVHVIVRVGFAWTESGGDGCTRRCTQLVRRGVFFQSRAVEF